MEHASHDTLEELVDVIDDHDRVIRVVPRSVMRRDNLLHRSVGILVETSSGDLLVHRRSDAKDVWPGRWDLAVGGVVSSGEQVTAAAERELAEEIGVTGAALELMGTGEYRDESVRCRCWYFRAVSDGPIHFADGEVAEARWVSRDELAGLLAAESFVPDSVALLRELRPDVFAGSRPLGHT